MNARERYYHLRHQERLTLWQIAQAEKEIARLRMEQREKIRRIRKAYKDWRYGITFVRRANVEYYNRAIARG